MTTEIDAEGLDPVMIEYERRMAIYKGYSAMPEPTEQEIADGAHILSEIIDDAAPLNERRYRFPAAAMLKFAAYLAATRTSEAAEPVAWMHPTHGWANSDRAFVATHCLRNGPGPIPLYAAPHPSPVSEEVTEAAFAVLEADKQFRASMAPSVERDPVTLACDRLAAALASLRSPKP